MVVVLGVLEKQGLLAETLCGEPKALHGDGVQECSTLQPCAEASGNLPTGGYEGRSRRGLRGARLLEADPGKIQFSSNKK